MTDARPPVPLTFVLPGFSKCGTTTLAELLGRHPDLLLPTKLEPWFFSEPDFAERWDWYQQLFPDSGRYRAIGDDSTTYTSHQVVEDVCDRLAELYPDLKLLFVARDPVARIESSYREFHNSGPQFGLDTPFTLHEAMDELPQLLRDSSYASLTDVYLKRFPERQMQVVYFEDLVADPQATLDRCFEFLGLAAGVVRVPEAPRRNKGENKLRDTRLLRSIRHSPLLGMKVARIPVPVQDRYFRKVGLRRRFSEPVEWTPEAVRRVREEVAPDARRFLQTYGAPTAGWPRLTALVGSGA